MKKPHSINVDQPQKHPSTSISRVLLIDSSKTFLVGLERAIWESEILHIVGEAHTASDVFQEGFLVPADLALIDIDLPDQSGIEVCLRLAKEAPKLKILLLSFSDWDIYLLVAKAVHATGLLYRNQPTIELVNALEKAVKGPVFTSEQEQRIQNWQETTGKLLRNLRKSEWQILQRISLGESNREIAEHLTLSKNTVEKHVHNILAKLDMASRSMMLVFIYHHHLDVISRIPNGDRLLMLIAN